MKGVWWHQFVYRLDSWPNDQLAVGYDDSKDGVNLISGLKKEYVWRPVQKAYTEKLSSTKLDKKQVSEVAEIVTRHLSQITGICIPFPEANHGG